MNCYITLDYELFMGRIPGTVEKCLIEPMKVFDAALSTYEIKATIFVDCAYLLRLSEIRDTSADYLKVVENIKWLSERGHNMQYHFHPQWLYAEYDINKDKWIMDFKHYKLADVDEPILWSRFKDGIELLQQITGKPVYAFRAGGYSLNSYSRYIELLASNNLFIDSSNNRGKVFSKLQVYDYSKSPQKPIYKFKDDVCIENCDGKFTEYSISQSNKKLWIIPYLFKKRYLSNKYKPTVVYGDGGGTSYSKYERAKALCKKCFVAHKFDARIDNIMSYNLRPIFDELQSVGQNDMIIIGHPKAFSDVAIRNLTSFVEYAITQGAIFKIIPK